MKLATVVLFSASALFNYTCVRLRRRRSQN